MILLLVSRGDNTGRLPPESVKLNETVTALSELTQDITFDIRKLAQMAERALAEVSGSNPEHSM